MSGSSTFQIRSGFKHGTPKPEFRPRANLETSFDAVKIFTVMKFLNANGLNVKVRAQNESQGKSGNFRGEGKVSEK